MEENVTYRKVKVRKLNKKNLVLLIIFLLLIILFIISLSKIFIWSKENKEIEKQTEKVLEVTTIETKVDSENTEIIEQTDIDKSNPYWDYIKMDLIDVNFEHPKKFISPLIDVMFVVSPRFVKPEQNKKLCEPSVFIFFKSTLLR